MIKKYTQFIDSLLKERHGQNLRDFIFHSMDREQSADFDHVATNLHKTYQNHNSININVQKNNGNKPPTKNSGFLWREIVRNPLALNLQVGGPVIEFGYKSVRNPNEFIKFQIIPNENNNGEFIIHKNGNSYSVYIIKIIKNIIDSDFYKNHYSGHVIHGDNNVCNQLAKYAIIYGYTNSDINGYSICAGKKFYLIKWNGSGTDPVEDIEVVMSPVSPRILHELKSNNSQSQMNVERVKIGLPNNIDIIENELINAMFNCIT
jgi:hypothetical protein